MNRHFEKISEVANDAASFAGRNLTAVQDAVNKAGTSTLAAGKKAQESIGAVVGDHKEVADKIETVSMGLGLTSGVAFAAAALVAPTGLSALGVAIGITSAPLIVIAAPIVSTVATAVGVVSGCAYFYSKWKTKKANKDLENS